MIGLIALIISIVKGRKHLTMILGIWYGIVLLLIFEVLIGNATAKSLAIYGPGPAFLFYAISCDNLRNPKTGKKGSLDKITQKTIDFLSYYHYADKYVTEEKTRAQLAALIISSRDIKYELTTLEKISQLVVTTDDDWLVATIDNLLEDKAKRDNVIYENGKNSISEIVSRYLENPENFIETEHTEYYETRLAAIWDSNDTGIRKFIAEGGAKGLNCSDNKSNVSEVEKENITAMPNQVQQLHFRTASLETYIQEYGPLSIEQIKQLLVPLLPNAANAYSCRKMPLVLTPKCITLHNNTATLDYSQFIMDTDYISPMASAKIVRANHPATAFIYSVCAVLFFAATGLSPKKAIVERFLFGGQGIFEEIESSDADFAYALKRGLTSDYRIAYSDVNEILTALGITNTVRPVVDSKPIYKNKCSHNFGRTKKWVIVAVAVILVALMGCFVYGQRYVKQTDEALLEYDFYTAADMYNAAYPLTGWIYQIKGYHGVVSYINAGISYRRGQYAIATSTFRNLYMIGGYDGRGKTEEECAYMYFAALCGQNDVEEIVENSEIIQNITDHSDKLGVIFDLYYIAANLYSNGSYRNAEIIFDALGVDYLNG